MEKIQNEIKDFYKERLAEISIRETAIPNFYKFVCIIDGEQIEVSNDTLNMKDIKDLRRFYLETSRFGADKYLLEIAESEPQEFKNCIDLYKAVLEYNKRGITIQRYKGLGEMNPEELKRTALDPDTRYLYKMYIGDEDDTIYTLDVYLGKNVEDKKKMFSDEE